MSSSDSSDMQSNPSARDNTKPHSPSVQFSPRKVSSAKSYLRDPLFRSAMRHLNEGELEQGLVLVNRLVKANPQSEDLLRIQKEIQRRIGLESNTFQANPLYRAALRHMKKGHLEQGLELVKRLQITYPGSVELQELQGNLQKRVLRKKEARQRRRLILAGFLLSMMFVCVAGLFARYMIKPAPLSAIILPQLNLNYPPHYLFSIYGVDKPVGIAFSPQAGRIYVSEMGGARSIKMFDLDGNPQGYFELPHTSVGERAPVYMSTDQSGLVYITDRKQHAVYIYTGDGNYVETLLAPDLTLSEYIHTHEEVTKPGVTYSYNLIQNRIFYQSPDGTEQSSVLPLVPTWSPLGIRIENHQMLLTDVTKDKHEILVIPLSEDNSAFSWNNFNPQISSYGSSGDGNAQFLFPNSVMRDSQGRIFVSDGNNGRVSVWDNSGNFLYNFGSGGSGDGALSLPRGLFIDRNDRLYVVDSVGQDVKVYDVSGTEPKFLFAFGDFGDGDGLFNFPNDITIDSSGKLYIVDRENDRIQVWSY